MEQLRLLIVEDREDEAAMIADELRAGGFDVFVDRVVTGEAMSAALRAPPDLVICDYLLPGFGAEQALKVLRDSGRDVPFILTSGYIGEEQAVEMMRAGARDFVAKDRLFRLVPVVRRELRDAQGRRQRREANEALHDSEAHFRLLAEHSQDVIFRCRLRPHVEVLYLSPAVRAVTGCSEAELLGSSDRFFGHIVDPQERAQIEEAWSSGMSSSFVVRWLRPDGTTAWLEHRAFGVEDDGRLVAVEGTLRDVTEQVLAERERGLLLRQLEHAARIESLGVLAGGVAHDFNNALAVILSSAALLGGDLGPDHPGCLDLARIVAAATRSADLTSQLLLFARREPAQTSERTLDLNAAVEGLEELIRRTIGANIVLTVERCPGPALVAIDQSKMEQVILNLVANARGAMPTGGSLRIETAQEMVAATDGLDLPAGPYLRLSITDTGGGISPEVLGHAFDPFFTTKAPGEGTGLGLSTAHGVVRQAGGDIALRSTVGVGTTVEIFLPAVASGSVDQTGIGSATVVDGDETVLVVDDNEDVRDVVTRILTRHRYRVVAAASGAEAVDLLSGDGACDPDLLLTDMIMPGMSGAELAGWVRARRPDLPCLYMSGYTADREGEAAVAGAEIALVKKPFSNADLVAAVRKALDTRHVPSVPTSPTHRTRQPAATSAGG